VLRLLTTRFAGGSRHGGGLLVIRNLKLSLFMNESLIEEKLTKKIIGDAIEVHRYWGTGSYRKHLREELGGRA
jgi:hypothetical protein